MLYELQAGSEDSLLDSLLGLGVWSGGTSSHSPTLRTPHPRARPTPGPLEAVYLPDAPSPISNGVHACSLPLVCHSSEGPTRGHAHRCACASAPVCVNVQEMCV